MRPRNASPAKTIIFFGDSLTEGVIGASYVDMLRQTLPGARVINAGINGDTVLNLLRRAERDVVAHDPDVVVVLVGLNDLTTAYGWRSNKVYYWLGKQVFLRVTPSRFIRGYRRLIATLRTRTQAQIVLCTLTTVGELPDEPFQHYIDAYSTIIRAIAGQEHLQLIDLRAVFRAALETDPRDGPPYRIWKPVLDGLAIRAGRATHATLAEQRGYRLLCDGAHLAENGARLVAETMLPILESVGITGSAVRSQ